MPTLCPQINTTTSSSARARPAACWPTGCPPTQRARAAARGRRQGQLPLDPHSRRLPLPDGQSARRLGLQDGRGAGPQRPQPRLSARPRAGRLLLHQRHDLHARAGARLRPVAADGQSRLGLGRRAALLQEAPGPVGARSPTRSTTCTRAAASGASSIARIRWEILDAFRDAAAEAGIPKVDDFNRGDNEGCGYFHVNQKTGIRWNTSKGFLRPVLHRRNLTSRRTRWSSGWCSTASASPGSSCARTATARTLRAAREVVLAAGAIGSPQILQLSGIGPGARAAAARHRGAARAGGRRREPAGPSADPLRLQGLGRQDHERALPEPACSAPVSPRSTPSRGAGR